MIVRLQLFKGGPRVFSTSSSHLRLAAIALVAAATLAVAGCGRKGDPEVPTVAKASDRPVGIPIGATSPAPAAVPTPAKKPFLLDPLL